MENPIRMDDLGGKPTIFGNIQNVKLLKIPLIDFRALNSSISGSFARPWGFSFPSSGKVGKIHQADI